MVVAGDDSLALCDSRRASRLAARKPSVGSLDEPVRSRACARNETTTHLLTWESFMEYQNPAGLLTKE